MVPGTQCNQRLWERLVPLLDGEIQSNHVAIERCATHAQMLAEIDRALSLGGHLLGFSMGGYLALQYALEHPNKVHSLVLLASSALGLSDDEKQVRKGMLDFLQTHTYQGMSSARIRQFVSQQRWQDHELHSVIKDMDKSLGGATLLRQIQETSWRQDLSLLLAELKCKVLIIGGRQDQKVPQEDLQAMTKQLSNAELLWLDDCGHMLPLEQPQALAQILNQFYLGQIR
ncbi:hypothetical protein BIW53_06525 [Pseudoalteromonas byunsanensis]|uniref:AB hydrolase-1 domain-containing protein n=2 Tax=Pseudoalteromonas byunsanensis TaxID=327939 RepID=A0A1S1N5A5_9GAMM|nr:hypothetical protein BIW53_06525 [Pseudoalteromonas byunsanensis]